MVRAEFVPANLNGQPVRNPLSRYVAVSRRLIPIFRPVARRFTLNYDQRACSFSPCS